MQCYCSAFAVLWCFSSLLLQCYVAAVLCFCSAIVLQFYSAAVLCYCSSMNLQFYSASVLWCCLNMPNVVLILWVLHTYIQTDRATTRGPSGPKKPAPFYVNFKAFPAQLLSNYHFGLMCDLWKCGIKTSRAWNHKFGLIDPNDWFPKLYVPSKYLLLLSKITSYFFQINFFKTHQQLASCQLQKWCQKVAHGRSGGPS